MGSARQGRGDQYRAWNDHN
jgi:hypothetical protein